MIDLALVVCRGQASCLPPYGASETTRAKVPWPKVAPRPLVGSPHRAAQRPRTTNNSGQFSSVSVFGWWNQGKKPRNTEETLKNVSFSCEG